MRSTDELWYAMASLLDVRQRIIQTAAVCKRSSVKQKAENSAEALLVSSPRQIGAHTTLSVRTFLWTNREPPYSLDLLPEHILVWPKFLFSLKRRPIVAVQKIHVCATNVISLEIVHTHTHTHTHTHIYIYIYVGRSSCKVS